MATKLVIYRDQFGWVGAYEYKMPGWFFKKINYAPIHHADSAVEVFEFLFEHYPTNQITYAPDLSKCYGG